MESADIYRDFTFKGFFNCVGFDYVLLETNVTCVSLHPSTATGDLWLRHSLG